MNAANISVLYLIYLSAPGCAVDPVTASGRFLLCSASATCTRRPSLGLALALSQTILYSKLNAVMTMELLKEMSVHFGFLSIEVLPFVLHFLSSFPFCRVNLIFISFNPFLCPYGFNASLGRHGLIGVKALLVLPSPLLPSLFH